jgi:predicted pyridoxine 5'-phosphate oxidase superfamily flavin-nucleotide-binding protein
MTASSTTHESAAECARRIIDANSYATLATADADGRPWATPVWFAERDRTVRCGITACRRARKGATPRPECP